MITPTARPGSGRRPWAAVLLAALLAGCGSTAAGSAAPPASTRPSGAASPAPTTSPSAQVDRELACVARLPRDVRIGQTMLVSGTDLARSRGWLDDGLIAGLLVFGHLDAPTAAAFRDATRGARYGGLLAADEEGGQVQRYEALVGSIPSARYQAQSMEPRQVRALYRELGESLTDWGVDMVLAPVADVGHGPGIGSRAYGDDSAVVARYAKAAARGLADAGQIPVVKHFPGHGSSSGDSHDQLVAGPGIDQLRAVDLVPFREILDAVDRAAVMVGHTTIPGYSREPSSQSATTMLGLLRGELGFGGLIVSDALGMAASGTDDQGEALVGFLAAGGDLGIVGPGGSMSGRRAVRAALKSGALSDQRLDEAAARVLAAKRVDPCDVVGGPVPDDVLGPAGSDAPVVNPTRQ